MEAQNGSFRKSLNFPRLTCQLGNGCLGGLGSRLCLPLNPRTARPVRPAGNWQSVVFVAYEQRQKRPNATLSLGTLRIGFRYSREPPAPLPSIAPPRRLTRRDGTAPLAAKLLRGAAPIFYEAFFACVPARSVSIVSTTFCC